MAAENLSSAALRYPRPGALFLALAWLALDQTGAWAQVNIGPYAGAGNGGNFGNIGTGGGGNAGNFGGGMFGFNGMQRFQFKIEPNAPLQNLLPVPPLLPRPLPPWLVKDLTQVPEVFFQKPLDVPSLSPKDLEQNTAAEKETLVKQAGEAQQRARAHVAHTLAKINHVNQKSPDHFVTVLLENRPDLAGLPFIMGDACRMKKGVGSQFTQEVFQLRPAFGGMSGMSGFNGGQFGSGGLSGGIGSSAGSFYGPPTPAEIARGQVAAWMQVLAPEPAAKRKELVKKLAGIQHAEASLALGKLAVFSLEKEIRDAALAALKKRPSDDYTAVLLQGLRYPWPEFARHATEAMVQLKRHDLIPTLVDFLDEPDPRAPAEQEIKGRTVPVVRELVRLNHHHNCITCHAPATSDPGFNKLGFTSDFVTGQVTVPVQSLAAPTPAFGYSGGSPTFPDLFLRVDVTYLRQDFSLLQKVDKGLTGAPMERFDFMVRTRAVEAKEVAAYQVWRAKQGPNYLSPNHQAALAALRRLTGRNAEPTAAAWREALEAN